MSALEHQNLLARAREIGGMDEAIVASPDYDYVKP